jgi:hypothetical protein
LRAIGLLIGAAVVYTSAVTDINTVRLKKYIISKLYPQIINLETNIEVTICILMDNTTSSDLSLSLSNNNESAIFNKILSI